MEDFQLIMGLQQKDPKAIDKLYDEWYPVLRYFANDLIKDPDQAKDIVITCLSYFLKGLREKKISISNASHLRNTLYDIVKKRCIDYLRGQSRNQEGKKKYFASFSEIYFIEQSIDQAYIMDKLHKEIEKLPKKCRQVFKMHYLDGLSQENIAEILKRSPSTIRNQLKDARDILRPLFPDDEWNFILVFLMFSYSMN